MKTSDPGLSRRQFVRQSACASLGWMGMVNTLAHLQLMKAAIAQSAPLPDYRALVVLFLFGGNDSNNMLIPRLGHPAYAEYKSGRSILRILDGSDPEYVAGRQASLPLNTSSGSYGVHPAMPAVATMFDAGELAFVANTGTLAHPITRAEYLDGTVPVPPQLFSHADQQVQWQSSLPDQPFSSGWGGRAADLLFAGGYATGQVSMSITIAGINSLQVGRDVIQYAVTPEGAVSLSGYVAGDDPYGAALNPDGSYRPTTQGHRLKGFESIMRYTHQHLLDEGYTEVVRRARANEALIGAALTAAATTGVDFDSLFANAQSNLGEQLKTIAKLIAGRDRLGNRRQIFFCSVGGFDTHQDQLTAHGNLMGELSGSLHAFREALGALGVFDNVLTVTHSDFTRTLTPNGTDPDSAGSDHGWGGHQLVMGGPVNGGKIYGSFPSLAIGSGQDVDRNRGRWIPTTAVDQYAAVAARWLGIEGTALQTIFPNLGRFSDPFGATANLGFV